MKTRLDKVTLIAFENGDLNKMIPALKTCLHYCDFPAVKLLSSFDMSDVNIDCEKIPVGKTSYQEYGRFMLGDIGPDIGFIGDYVDTEFMLFIHYDGFILNPNAWTDEFYAYDYIGAKWPCGGVGNGGFTLRSKKLLDTIKNIPGFNNTSDNEDYHICVKNKILLEGQGIKFAHPHIADQFSVENQPWTGSFGAHYIGSNQTDTSKWTDIDIYRGFKI